MKINQNHLRLAKQAWARTNKLVAELVDRHDPATQQLRNEQGRQYQERVRRAVRRLHRTGRINAAFIRMLPFLVIGLLGGCAPAGYDPQYVASLNWEASAQGAEAHSFYVAREICDARSRRHVYGYSSRYVIDMQSMTYCMAAKGFVVNSN